MQSLRVAYLIIPSSYDQYIKAFYANGCFNLDCFYDFTLYSGASVNLVRQFPVSLNNYSWSGLIYLNSISLKITERPMANRGLSVSASFINSTHYYLVITSTSNYPILLQGYLVTVIIYQTSSFSYGLKITHLTHTIPNTLNHASISPTATFFGIRSYSFMNMAMQFSILITNQMATNNVDANTVAFIMQIISF